MLNVTFPKLKFEINLKLSRSRRKPKKLELYTLPPDTPAEGDEFPDFFQREEESEKIVYAILTSKGQMNFLVAGEWGMGKTSILNLIERSLKKQGIRSIWFSPWKYSGSSEGSNAISRAFLTKLAMEFGKLHDVKDLYIKKEIESERNIATQLLMLLPLFLRYILYWGLIFSLLNLAVSLIPPLKHFLKELNYQDMPFRDMFALLISTSAILALPPLGEYFVSKIRQRGEVEKISSPELIEQKFHTLINRSLKIKWLQQLISLWEETFRATFLQFVGEFSTNILFYRGIFSFLKTHKIVIFVDDLDRCNGTEVREFLSGMKTFLEHKKVYYIVAADVDKLRDKADKEEPEFLRKIIQIDWNMPSLDKDQLKIYIEKILTDAGAPDDFVDIDGITHLFQISPNPRKVKYYLRRLLFLSNLIEK